ncbi:expressed unknown protein (Partial), partial [Seminavis robusta]
AFVGHLQAQKKGRVTTRVGVGCSSSKLGSISTSINSSKNHTKSFCDRVNTTGISKDCSCRNGNETASDEGPLSFVVECERAFESMVFNDTIGLKLVVAPCDQAGSSVSFNVVEKNHNLDYEISGIHAGDEVNYPIPGVSAIVPGIGHIGIDVAVLIFGNPDELSMKVGVNACAAVRDKQVCASAIPGLSRILPWWILWGTYSFGDICTANSTSTAAAAVRMGSTPMERLAKQQQGVISEA